ncbi:MAG: transposase [Saprospiraceae bacterium]|uniref:Transposase n=1 Tax=Candidatus Opimibacter skivensis TaxID=2982028 RepID=A0A9D7XNG4_9BACT|nr:transposase [Candidatus Opimibacter skivensis]
MSRYKILDQEGLNFITCTIVGWIDIFSRQSYRDLLLDSLKFCRKEKGLLIFAYVIMSNHIHLIVQTNKSARQNLSEIIRDFKKFTANGILEKINTEPESRREWLLHMFRYHARFNTNNRYFQVWQQDNHPILLYSQPIIWQKVNYIHMNPVRAGIVDNPLDYLYSSARNYERENRDCLMEIDLLEPYWTDAGRVE